MRQPPLVNRRSSVNRLVNRQPVDAGERFASDCGIRQPVWSKGHDMKLVTARVTNFRSVEDSGEFEVDGLMGLVGKNEAGKTAARREKAGRPRRARVYVSLWSG